MKIVNHFTFLNVILSLTFTSCSYITHFKEKQLDVQISPDATAERTYKCTSNCDCTMLGPCWVCDKNNETCRLPEEADGDGDGYFSPRCNEEILEECCAEVPDDEKDIYCPNGNDCDDGDPTTHPNAQELCNGKDDNCNGIIDEDEGTFGLARESKKLTDGSKISFCSLTGNSPLIWNKSPAGSQLYSGFFDVDGNLLNQKLLTDSWFSPSNFSITCMAGIGAVATWSERSGPITEVIWQKLDLTGNPIGDPLKISSDEEKSGDVVIAYLENLPVTENLPITGVAWLSYDKNVTNGEISRGSKNSLPLLFNVRFAAVQVYSDEIIPLASDVPGEYYIASLPADNPQFPVEKIDIAPFYIKEDRDKGIDRDRQGFGIVWNSTSGIHFAPIECMRQNEQINCEIMGNVKKIEMSSYPHFPSITWAGDKFYVAFGYSTRIKNISSQIVVFEFQYYKEDNWQYREVTTPMGLSDLNENTYPVLQWTEDIKEVVFVWGQGEQIGKRQIKLIRIKPVSVNTTATEFIPVLGNNLAIEVSSKEFYTGRPFVTTTSSGGYLIGWPQNNENGETELWTAFIACKR